MIGEAAFVAYPGCAAAAIAILGVIVAAGVILAAMRTIENDTPIPPRGQAAAEPEPAQSAKTAERARGPHRALASAVRIARTGRSVRQTAIAAASPSSALTSVTLACIASENETTAAADAVWLTTRRASPAACPRRPA